MKNIGLYLFPAGLLFFFVLLIFPLPCYPEASGLSIVFPTLEQQLVSSIEAKTDREEAEKYLADYYNQNDAEMLKGFSLVLQEDVYSYWAAKDMRKENYALTLLVYLLENGAFLPWDTMTIALAVANNYIYSIADEPTRKQIRQDLVHHFEYYKRILSWQKSMRIRYDLARSPVIPKIYWAHRQRNLDLFREIKKLHLEEYKEFVDTIENLELMHDILTKNNLAEADSLIAFAWNIEQFTEKKLIYRAKIDQHRNKLKNHPDDKNARQALEEYERGEYTIDFRGKKRRWDLFYWLNYQSETYRKFGYFKGDCMTETTFQMNLYKAAGIPSMANQVRPVVKGGYSHNSPLFYNVFFNKWDSIQRPRKGEADYYVHFEKPVWHHFRYERDGGKYNRNGREVYSSYWQGEKTGRQEIVRFRDRGFTDGHFEELFFSDTTQQPGFIFNSRSAPDLISDADNDGILDEFETVYKTNPSSPDTDRDGFADLWEIEWGYQPSDRSSHPVDDTLAIDGLSARETEMLRLDRVQDPSHDYKADREIYDIASVGAKLLDKKIYVAVTYHNDIRKNTRDIHTLRISAEHRGKKKRIAFQWVRGKIYAYEVTKKGWIKQECNQQDFAISTVRETEITIPTSFFDKNDVLQIRYQATGIKGNKSTNNSDGSGTVMLDLTKNGPT